MARPRPTAVATARRLLAAVLVLLAAGPVASAHAGCGGVQTARPAHRPAAPLAVGDSTMLLALPSLARAGFAVNAHGCRQFPEALALLRHLRDHHGLPPMVVVALGADGSVTKADIRAALAIVGHTRRLVLVTPIELGGGSGQDAATVRDAGARADGRVTVLDWVRYSAGHADWFQPDGVHLTFGGAAAFARFLRRALLLAPLPPPFSGIVTLAGAGPGPAARLPFALRLTLPRGWRVTGRTALHRLPVVRLRAGGRCPAALTVSAGGDRSPARIGVREHLRPLLPPAGPGLTLGQHAAGDRAWASWAAPADATPVRGLWTQALGDPFPRNPDAGERAFLDVRVNARPLAAGGAACTRAHVAALLGALR
ncbi:hypothetical protein NBH00_00125 [Paraconexibacter antarcticus]|uniref:SGNH hydrolase-type esterase domain-containing protein n=1 Tax=Paraconexibacter antarcticus TaxID=2949664 RepID=A0ABY5DVB4_9ACTN|nr:hypothetical protein [Paraconexibacter antarcticus]UTI64632.1 hypothetical protein NBH00_00125 [Paraconexibacter antarcticus]